jgi:hypothetical protein
MSPETMKYRINARAIGNTTARTTTITTIQRVLELFWGGGYGYGYHGAGIGGGACGTAIGPPSVPR